MSDAWDPRHLMHKYTTAVQDRGGIHYRVLAFGEQRPDGRWVG